MDFQVIEAQKSGQITVALGQVQVIGSDIQGNTDRMIEMIDAAKSRGATIVVFPEMAVPGYLIGDRAEDEAFVRECMHQDERLQAASQGITLIYGTIVGDFRFWTARDRMLGHPLSCGNDGRLLKYNAARIWVDGQPAQRLNQQPQPSHRNQAYKVLPFENMQLKTNPANYGRFTDPRHMMMLKDMALRTGLDLSSLMRPFVVPLPNGDTLNIGVIICEDGWIGDYYYNGQLLNPAKLLVDNGAEMIFMLSASPYSIRKIHARLRSYNALQASLINPTTKSSVPLLAVNCVGLQNDGKGEYVFDGHSYAASADGRETVLAPVHKPVIQLVSMNRTATEDWQAPKITLLTKQQQREELLDSLIYGIRRFYNDKGLKGAIIGLSGGIDSALSLYLHFMALGKDRVKTINMPTEFNSASTKNAAAYIAEQLEVEYVVQSIQAIVDATRETYSQVIFDQDPGLLGSSDPNQRRRPDENLQAVTRMLLLSAVSSNYPGWIFTNNGNKSEFALGYFTMNGDGRGALAAIADLFKIQIIDIAVDINLDRIERFGKSLIPWELIKPYFVPERYYDNWDGVTYPTEDWNEIEELDASAELSAAQKDPFYYSYVDVILAQFIRERFHPEFILQWLIEATISQNLSAYGTPGNWTVGYMATNFATPSEWIEHLELLWNRFHQSIYQQIPAVPTLAVSERPLAYDLRRTQQQVYWTTKYSEYKDTILAQNTWDSWLVT